MNKNKKIPQFQKEGVKYYLGLDLGISSVGWAVMAQDIKTNKHFLHDFGVRIFDIAEDGKTGFTDAQKRRQFRGQRRLIRRRAYRIEKVKKILEKINFLTKDEFQKLIIKFKSTNKIFEKNGTFFTEEGFWNPFVARSKGLKQKLEKWEIYAILIHFCKKRGYLDRFQTEEQEQKEGTKVTKFSKALDEGERGVEKEYISNFILKNKNFRINTETENGTKKFLLYSKNGKLSLLPKENQDTKKNENNYRYLFSRKAYEKELKQIFNVQEKNFPELKTVKKEIIDNTIFAQRDFEVGPKCKDHYNGKCNKNACSHWKTFLESVGKCEYYPEENRGFKSSLLFGAYFFITEISKFFDYLGDERIKIFFERKVYQTLLKNFVSEGWQKKDIRKYLETTPIWQQQGSKDYFKVEMWRDDKSGMNLSKGKFLKEIRKIPQFLQELKQITSKKNWIETIDKHWINELGDILNKNYTTIRREEKIQQFLNKKNITLNKEDWKLLIQMKKDAVTTAKVSFSHMKKMITLFCDGKSPLKTIHSRTPKVNKGVGKTIFAKIIDQDLKKNPVVFRAINQTRKILKALHNNYGSFTNINVEVARDVAKSWKDRNKIRSRQLNNEKQNEKVKKRLSDEGIIVNFTNLIAWKLWEQQRKNCIYCGEKILEKNISPSRGEVQIDHIIPISKLGDNSFDNKILICSDCNQKKGNKTPLEWITNKEKRKKYLARLGALRKTLGWKKYNYLKNLTPDELEDFVSRNLNDTRWITKYILGYVKNQVKHFYKKEKTEILAIPGGLTSKLRREWLRGSAWGLDTKVRDITPFHHAVDAMIVAQIKSQWDLELSIDLLRLQKQKNKIIHSKTEYWKNENNTDYKTLLISTKNKWQLRNEKYNSENKIKKYFTNKTLYLESVENAEKNEKFTTPIYIKDLKTQIETRIPVKLITKHCECNIQDIEKCLECSGSKVIPKFEKLLDQKEWEKEKLTSHELINIKYPIISHMINYKIRGSFTSSEIFGFGQQEQGKLKTLYYKIWRKDPNLENPAYKKLIEKEKWNKWVKLFKNEEGFIFDKKTGNIILTNSYYGVLLPKNKSEKEEWLRIIDLKKKKEKKLNWDKKLLMIKGVSVKYYDNKQNKWIIKTFRGKRGNSTCIHPNQLNFICTLEKNKKVFNNWINYYDNISNIKKEFEIINIDILGNIKK